MFLSTLKKFFFSSNNPNFYYKKKTFTYFLPAPPLRKQGYQEKEFDYLIEKLVSMGFIIDDLKVSSGTHNESSGIWIVVIIRAKTKEAFDRKIDLSSEDLNHPPQGDLEIEYD